MCIVLEWFSDHNAISVAKTERPTTRKCVFVIDQFNYFIVKSQIKKESTCIKLDRIVWSCNLHAKVIRNFLLLFMASSYLYEKYVCIEVEFVQRFSSGRRFDEKKKELENRKWYQKQCIGLAWLPWHACKTLTTLDRQWVDGRQSQSESEHTHKWLPFSRNGSFKNIISIHVRHFSRFPQSILVSALVVVDDDDDAAAASAAALDPFVFIIYMQSLYFVLNFTVTMESHHPENDRPTDRQSEMSRRVGI